MKPHKCKVCNSLVEYKNNYPHSISYLANFWCPTCQESKFPHNVEEVEEVIL
jgi:hypothetical protein